MVVSHWIASASVGVALGAVVSIVTEPFIIDPLPTVDIISVEVVGREITYNRVVNSESDVRAPYIRSIVDVKSEKLVPECELNGVADFRIGEDQVQAFSLGDACTQALTVGYEYRAFAAITPLTGGSDTLYGEPFTWTGQ